MKSCRLPTLLGVLPAVVFVLLAQAVGLAERASATQGDLLAAGYRYSASTYSGHSNIFGSTAASNTVDIANTPLNTPVYAPENGTVSVHSTGYGGGYGNSIIWTSADGRERIHVAHLNSIVKTGSVSAGDLIARVGSTGLSTGAHMHVARSYDGVVAPVVLSGTVISPGWDPAVTWYTSRGPMGSGSISEGSFVQVAGSSAIYRIAGGAPLYVSNWSAVGGPQPFSVISQAQFDALRRVPADGTFLDAGGAVYRVAGGAPLYVSNWANVGGVQPYVTVDRWVIDNITNPAAHLNAVPSNGALISSTATGRVYVIAGGAPIYVSNWAAIGGARPCVGVDQWVLNNITHPAAHLRAVPSNGTLVSSSATGRVYVIAGGAPIYVSNWAAIGGSRPAVLIDQWALDNVNNVHAHLNAVPSNGTFLNTSRGHVYRVAGGAPIAVSSWSLFGGVQPYVTIDQWAIDNISNPHAHLRAVPADGTLVKGLPSGAYWVFKGGQRHPAAASPQSVAQDDVGLSAFPLPDTEAPTTTLSGLPSGWTSQPVTLTFTASDSGGSGVSHTQYKLGSGAWTTGSSVTISTSGTTTVQYRATDKAGNVETAKSATVRIDTSKPVTTLSGLPSGWTNKPVSLTFTATDSGGSGVARIEYRLNGGAWQSRSGPAITAQGATTVEYRATDKAGNLETPKSATVLIDSRAPVVQAYAASVRRTKAVRLRFRTYDGSESCGAGSAVITIKRGTRTVKRFTLRGFRLETLAAKRFTCRLRRGLYVWQVVVTDAAGNRSQMARAKLRVR